MSFSLDQFVGDFDLNLMTRVLEQHTNCFAKIREIFRLAKWNAVFQAKEANISSNLCEKFKPYRESSRSFFRRLFADGIAPEAILDFYLSSVYKWILPLEQFLQLADKSSSMLPVLSKWIFLCRAQIRDGDFISNFIPCRLRNVLCAPICEIIMGVNEVNKGEVLQVVCINYSIADGAVTHIDFQRIDNSSINLKSRASFFGYIARNTELGIMKKSMISRLLPVEKYGSRELVFFFICMDKAIHIRRTSGANILRLLQDMGNKNPFSSSLNFEISNIYLNKVRDVRSKKKRNSSRDDLISIVLNTPNMAKIAEIYLNTSLKFYASPEELARIIAERKPETSGRLAHLFDNCGLSSQERDKWFAFLKTINEQI